jgi:YHS domain-containing protein
MFFLVDTEGNVRGVYDSNDDAALNRLRADADRLLGAKPRPAPSPVRSPEQLTDQLGCNACHSNPKLAPPFRELAHTERALENGGLATVNEQYVRQSILAPGVQVALGYLKLMPSYQGHMSDAELDGLVVYLLEQAAKAPPTPGGTEPSPARIEIDPVCAMQVRATGEALTSKHEGKDYYFCAKSCLHRFEQNPAEFLLKK